MAQTMYEIRVAGTVPDQDLKDMGAVILPNHVNTVLYGISDQAALYGLLARLRALGREVVEVRREQEPVAETEDSGGTDHARSDSE
jgi:hypothetical protein